MVTKKEIQYLNFDCCLLQISQFLNHKQCNVTTLYQSSCGHLHLMFIAATLEQSPSRPCKLSSGSDQGNTVLIIWSIIFDLVKAYALVRIHYAIWTSRDIRLEFKKTEQNKPIQNKQTKNNKKINPKTKADVVVLIFQLYRQQKGKKKKISGMHTTMTIYHLF